MLPSGFVPSVDEVAEHVCDVAGDDAAARLPALEQFVVNARVDGLSWTRIAELAGTSERAAQKRYAALSVLAGAWPGDLADRFAGP